MNRPIGDEQLPEDSQHNPNGTLKQWPQWMWKKDQALGASGLIGPVTLEVPQEVSMQ